MNETEFRALVDKGQAVYDAIARGMGSSKTPHDVHCANVDKLTPDEKNLTDAEIGLMLVGGKL